MMDARLRRDVARMLDAFAVPGAAIAIVRGDDIEAEGFGLCAAGAAGRVNEHTLFQVGSTTKSFTALALALLVDEGLINWTTPVASLLQDFDLADRERARAIQVSDLLCHATGFIDTLAHALEVLTLDEALARMRVQTRFRPFRTSYVYSNLMYALAGRLVEIVSSLSWSSFLKTRIFAPLGMSRSGANPLEYWDEDRVAPTIFGRARSDFDVLPHAGRNNLAMPHFVAGSQPRVLAWQDYGAAAGAGAVISCAADMGRWAHLHISGAGDRRLPLKSTTLMTLHAAHNLNFPGQFPFSVKNAAAGLGWRRHNTKLGPFVWHSGLMLGFPAFVGLLPERHWALVVLANGQSATRETSAEGEDALAFHKALALTVLEGGERDWVKPFVRRSARARLRTAARDVSFETGGARIPFQAVEGVYHDRSGRFGDVSLRRDDQGDLSLSFADAGAFSARLEHLGGGAFRMRALGVPYAHFLAQFDLRRGRTARLTVFDATFERAGGAPGRFAGDGA